MFPRSLHVFAYDFSIIFTSCSGIKEDTRYLTPIPQETILAHRRDMPINNKLDAATVAQRFLRNSRLDYEELPPVVVVEKINLEEAHQ